MTRLHRTTARLLLACMLCLNLPQQALGGMIPTDQAAPAGARERVTSALSRAEVRARLEAYGVAPAEVRARVEALTDEEAAQLAGRIDALPAAGNGIVGAIVLVFLVLLLTDILGVTKVYPFTKPLR